jgi:proton-dependent oligopeptide transporter, POT family
MTPAEAAVLEKPKGHPKGLWVLVFTETWERMSFYGTRPLLMLYMKASAAMGGLGLDLGRATAIFAGYYLSLYVFALSGGQIADRFLGAKRTILLGGLFIALGQLLLQIHSTSALLFSLTFIAVGTCLMKPNLSASVGKLYGKDDPRRDGAFTIEYAGINVGSVMAVLICGYMANNPSFIVLLRRMGLDSPNGWAWAFGMTGFGMLLSLVNFVLRRRLVEDQTLQGQPEPRPVGLGFVAFQVALVVGLAYLVISSQNPVVQLLAGIGGAIFLMFGVQAVISRGLVSTRAVGGAPAGSAAHAEHHKLSGQDWTRIGVVGLMIAFSLIFWMLFQQAGSTFNLFARDYSKRVFGNAEAQAIALEQAKLRVTDLPAADRAVKAFDKSLKDLGTRDQALVDTALRLRTLSKQIQTLRDMKPAHDTVTNAARRAAEVARLEGELPALQNGADAARTADPAVAADLDAILAQVKLAEDRYNAVANEEKRLEAVKSASLQTKGGFEIPPVYVLVTNPTLVVLLGAFFAALWRRRSGKWPSSPVKFALGLLCVAVALAVMTQAARLAQPAMGAVVQVSLGWLFGTYLFSTLGELCLSPVGLAYVSKLAPKQLGSQMMGIWFFGSGLGSYAAGKIASNMAGTPLYLIFGWCSLLALFACLLLWLFVSRYIEKLMGGYS